MSRTDFTVAGQFTGRSLKPARSLSVLRYGEGVISLQTSAI